MDTLSIKKLTIIGAVLGAAYGLFARFIFGFGIWKDFFEVMSLAFIFGVPLSLGFIAVWFGPLSGHGCPRWLVWFVRSLWFGRELSV